MSDRVLFWFSYSKWVSDSLQKMFVFWVFLGNIFPHSDWIRIQPEAGKYGPEKTPNTDAFHALWISNLLSHMYQFSDAVPNACIQFSAFTFNNFSFTSTIFYACNQSSLLFSLFHVLSSGKFFLCLVFEITHILNFEYSNSNNLIPVVLWHDFAFVIKGCS